MSTTTDTPDPPGRDRWMLVSIGLGVVVVVMIVGIVVLVLARNGGGGGGGTTDCTTTLPEDVYAPLNVDQPTYEVTGYDVCFVHAILYLPGTGTGMAYVRVGDAAILGIDIANFDEIGEPGAGSGEREVQLPVPAAVQIGQRITLDLEACTGCRELTVGLRGGPAASPIAVRARTLVAGPDAGSRTGDPRRSFERCHHRLETDGPDASL